VKREISAMKLLNHPNIVKIHEVNIWDSEFHRTSVVFSILRINTELVAIVILACRVIYENN
jgi:hypothetical protein